MAMVREAARKMDGKIEFSNATPNGTVASLRLPKN
jgi:signal transduction histidine kinase